MVMQARVRDEMKTVDTTLSAGTLNFDNNSAVAARMQHINVVTQGTSAIQRIGKRLIMKAVQIRGVIKAASATTVQKCSLLLVYVRSVNSISGTTTLPAMTEIMTNQSANSLTNRDYAGKYKILRRWDFVVTGNITNPATGNEEKIFEEYIVFKKPLLTQFNSVGTTGVYDQVEKGALLLISLGEDNYLSTTTPLFTGYTRVYFSESDGYAY